MTEYEKILEMALYKACENSIYHQQYTDKTVKDLMSHWIKIAKQTLNKE